MPTNPPPKPRAIKQDEMNEVLNQRLVIDTLKRDLKKAEEQMMTMELVLIDRVERGATQERGDLSLAVDAKNGQKHTPWKELYAGLAGADKVDAELKKTQAVNALAENQKKILVVMNDGRVEKTA